MKLGIADVERARPEDLAFILGWLQREYDEDSGTGFWANRRIISAALDEPSELWVIRHGGEAIAFQVGDYAADIVSVRKDYRHLGVGRLLFEASLQRALRDNINVLQGQCAPEVSLGFWQRMGFDQIDCRSRPHDVIVRRILQRSFDLPPSAPRAAVMIGFYPEQALYGEQGDRTPPLVEWHVEGARLPEGTIMLERRVLGLADDEPKGDDLAVKISVDGRELCFCKAKYDEARHLGVVRDWRANAFYLDHVTPDYIFEE